VVHAAWSVAGLSTLGYIWWCAITRRRDRILAVSIGFLTIEGVGLVVGRGDCPMAEVQAEWGDPVPFFELVLPPRAAKAAVPTLALATVAGFLAVVMRRPKAPPDGGPSIRDPARGQPANSAAQSPAVSAS
jgi:hypothetical protein